jgi:hypothetical protein
MSVQRGFVFSKEGGGWEYQLCSAFASLPLSLVATLVWSGHAGQWRLCSRGFSSLVVRKLWLVGGSEASGWIPRLRCKKTKVSTLFAN